MRWPIFWIFWALCASQAIPIGFSLLELSHLAGDPVATHKVVLHISKDKADVGLLVLALFGQTAPKTVENFVGLASMAPGYGYHGTIFHRVIKDFIIQGGDFERGDGTGGYLIFDKKLFADENFDLHHDKRGRLSMANAGKDTNGAQFFITTSESSAHLNGHHVVFGQLVGGFEVLDLLNTAPTGENDRPVSRWAIEDADIFVEPPAETGSLGSYRFFMGLCLVSSVCYAAVQWNHRRKKVVITGFRSM